MSASIGLTWSVVGRARQWLSWFGLCSVPFACVGESSQDTVGARALCDMDEELGRDAWDQVHPALGVAPRTLVERAAGAWSGDLYPGTLHEIDVESRSISVVLGAPAQDRALEVSAGPAPGFGTERCVATVRLPSGEGSALAEPALVAGGPVQVWLRCAFGACDDDVELMVLWPYTSVQSATWLGRYLTCAADCPEDAVVAIRGKVQGRSLDGFVVWQAGVSGGPEAPGWSVPLGAISLRQMDGGN